MAKTRTAVLISGRGSNMVALLNAAEAKDYPAEITLVLSNRADAAGLAAAEKRGVESVVIDHREFDDRVAFEAALNQALGEGKIELVCLAGFMRLLTADFVDAWRDRLINIHPSILPAFKGLQTHERALAAGVRIHGATAHFVRAEMDEGPVIVQGAVPVFPGDTAEDLAERVLAVEHRIYPIAVALVAGRKARVVSEKVMIDEDSGHAGDVLIVPHCA
jgi:phosphoribosylglycinamide formyltransferase-1